MPERTAVIPVSLPNQQTLRVEATALGGDEDVAFTTRPFVEMLGAVEGLVAAVSSALAKVSPKKTTLEFGVEVGVEGGQLVALLVKGTGKANLKLTLEW
jgi:Trypsin-co-occurring domain 1